PRTRFDGAADQVFARLRQHNNGDVVRDTVFVDELPYEIEVGLRSRRKADLDFLEADFHQLLKEAQFALNAHRFDQGLIAIAQIRTHPDRRMGDALTRPSSFGKIAIKRDERTIFVGGIGDHGAPVYKLGMTLSPKPDQCGATNSKVAEVRLPNCHRTLGPATDR